MIAILSKRPPGKNELFALWGGWWWWCCCCNWNVTLGHSLVLVTITVLDTNPDRGSLLLPLMLLLSGCHWMDTHGNVWFGSYFSKEIQNIDKVTAIDKMSPFYWSKARVSIKSTRIINYIHFHGLSSSSSAYHHHMQWDSMYIVDRRTIRWTPEH